MTLRTLYTRIPLFMLFIGAAGIRFFELFKTTLYTWDGSVYIGIGKYFFSGGTVGLVEVFRPIILALIQGGFWKLGIDPTIGGGITVIIASLILGWTVYRIGERIIPTTGIYAALILVYTPVFVLYSHIPMSDVLSSCFVLIGLFLGLRKKFFLSGLIIALAFLTRFAQGLGVVVLTLSIIVMHYRAHQTIVWKLLLKELVLAGFGFLTLVLPYFLWAFHTYGDPLIPLRAGTEVIGHSLHVYARGPWFYLIAPIQNNPLYAFGILGVIYTLYHFIRTRKISQELIVISIGLIVYLTYFSFEVHKELRYSIAILPFLAVFAGYGMSLIIRRIRASSMLVILMVLALGSYLTIRYKQFIDPPMNETRTTYYSFFSITPPGTTLIATEPISVEYGDTRLLAPMYDSWRHASEVYLQQKNNAAYVALDSCTLESACSVNSSCLDGKDALLQILAKEGEQVFFGTDNSCTLQIYKLHK